MAQETGLGFENARVVVVEAKNHAAPHFDPGFLDAVHALDDRARRANILKFLGFSKGSLIGAFDADEDADDVGLHHQLQELRVLRQVERGLREEIEGIAVGTLIGDQLLEQDLDGLLVADEVVIDDECDLHALGPQRFEFRNDLRASLQARPPAEGHDNVAEFTLEWAAP